MTATWKRTYKLHIGVGRKSFYAQGGRLALCGDSISLLYRINRETKTIWLVLTNRHHRDAILLITPAHEWSHVMIDGNRVGVFPWLHDELIAYGNGKPVYAWIELEHTA